MTGSDNPYRPPPPGADAPPATDAAGGRAVALYTTGQVVLATFLGTPLAGALVMALNDRRVGRPAGGTVLLGALATALLTGLAFLIPDGIPQLALNVAALLGMHRVCNSVQGERVQAHLAQGGERGSSWAAVGIGLACAAALVVVVAGGYVAIELLRPSAMGQ